MNIIGESKSQRRHTFVNAPIAHPVRRESRECRSPWRIVRNPSEHLRDTTAPNRVVTRQLIETTVNADVLNRHLTARATNIEVVIDGRREDWALAQTSLGVRASVDRLLENRVRGGIPTVLEISMAGVPDVVTSS